MNKFNNLIKKLNEDMTTGSVFGAGQAHPTAVGQSGDFYAPGDARNIFGGITKKKKKKTKKESVPIIRRTFPGM
jgi:hypothetical protein